MDIRGQWALVTGASSGIGRDLARELGRRGCHCVLVARRAERLEETARELREQFGVEAEVEVGDLAEEGAAARLHASLAERGRVIDVLINNAGIGQHGNFVDQDLDRLRTMMRLNMFALTELCHLFGRGMAERGRGRIMNVASIAGLNPVPSYAVYGATKAFVVSMSESISLELGSRGVTVTCVMPGVTWTEFFDTSGQKTTLYNRIVGMQSADVARMAVKAMLQGRSSIVTGWQNWVTMGLTKFLPRRLNAWASWQFMRND